MSLLGAWRKVCSDSIHHRNIINETEVPENLLELANEKKNDLIEALAEADDELAEMYIDEKEIGPDDLTVSVLSRRGVPFD